MNQILVIAIAKKEEKRRKREEELPGEKVGKNIYKSQKKYRGLP